MSLFNNPNMAKDDNICLSGFSLMCVSGGGGWIKMHIPFNDTVSVVIGGGGGTPSYFAAQIVIHGGK